MKDYGSVLNTCLRAYEMGARASGRTAAMVEQIKEGDTVVFLSEKEADRVRRMLKERGKEARIIVSAPADMSKLIDRLRGYRGNPVHLDHSWAYDFWQRSLDESQRQLDAFVEFLRRD